MAIARLLEEMKKLNDETAEENKFLYIDFTVLISLILLNLDFILIAGLLPTRGSSKNWGTSSNGRTDVGEVR